MARKTFGRDGSTVVVNEGSTVYAVRTDDDINSGGTSTGTVDHVASEVGHPDFEPVPGGQFNVTVDDDPNTVGQSYVDPTTINPRTGKPRRKRGPNKSKQGVIPTAVVTANLEKVLVNLHLMGAALLSEPELQIDQDEAALLSGAIAEVATAYNWAAVISPKTQATIDMGIALATVYGKRAMTIYHKHKRKGGPVRVQPIQAPQVQNVQ